MAGAKSAERTEGIYSVDGRWRERAIILHSCQTHHIEYIFVLAGNILELLLRTGLDIGFGTEQGHCDIDPIADLPKLKTTRRDRGYSHADIEAIAHGNWIRYCEEDLPDA
jgi:microsomal dipeptidase-like Zn-dependent dipeptidase